MTRLNRFLFIPLLTAVIAPIAPADHLPEGKRAQGKGESVLCGIDLQHASLEDLTKLLGEPTAVREDARVWKTQNVKVEVGIDRVLNPDNTLGQYYVSYVEVWGRKPDGKFGRTGRGLALGDTIERLRALYGNRYVEKGSKGVQTVSIEWRDTTWLDVEFDGTGHVNHIKLLSPE